MDIITLQKLETSIKKITDLIDINLDNLDEQFLVDNFKPSSNLRSTKLRKEFNSLCKNKAETKNIEEKGLSFESKKIYLCKENQVRDVPPIINPIFKDPKKLYLMGVPAKNSFIHSILNIMETDFLLKGPIQKENSIDGFRNTIVYNLDDLYKKYNYKNKRFKKSTLRDNILSSKVILPQTINLISDYFGVCLVIIDTDTHLYSLGNDFKTDGKFIVMLRKNSTYQPILSTEGKHYFEQNILEKLEKILKPEIEIDKSPLLNSSDEEVELPEVMGKEKDYKISQLQKMAEKLDISIFESDSKKKKLKKNLYLEISEKIAS